MKEYTVTWPTEHTVLLTDEDAKLFGAKPVEAKKPAAKANKPANKSATAANKANG